jgi:hypothetical protein
MSDTFRFVVPSAYVSVPTYSDNRTSRRDTRISPVTFQVSDTSGQFTAPSPPDSLPIYGMREVK